jgi:hypothetical protein
LHFALPFYYILILYNHWTLLLLSITTVIPQTYIYFVRLFPHPEVMPVMGWGGYEVNKDDDDDDDGDDIPHKIIQ